MAALTCACPRHGARECYRWRHNIDLRELIDGVEVDDEEACECWCHEEEGEADLGAEEQGQ